MIRTGEQVNEIANDVDHPDDGNHRDGYRTRAMGDDDAAIHRLKISLL
jgi:hypothetical protein